MSNPDWVKEVFDNGDGTVNVTVETAEGKKAIVRVSKSSADGKECVKRKPPFRSRVTIEEVGVCFRAITYSEVRGRIGIKDICPLSKKELKPGMETYLVINNYRLFPNCFVDAREVGYVGFEKAALKLLADYREGLKYRYWFSQDMAICEKEKR